MLTIKEKLGVKVGYSDHSLGDIVPVVATSLGASIIEKHFTLNKNYSGPDHKASLEPKNFFQLVKYVRNIESAIGDGIKKPTKSEKKNISIVRKFIVASKRIKKGNKFTKDNLTIKRCGKGLDPALFFKILGKTSKKNFNRDEIIKL